MNSFTLRVVHANHPVDKIDGFGEVLMFRTGRGLEIVQADPTALIDLRLYVEIAHGHHHWARLNARTGIMHLGDDVGRSYVYKCSGWHPINGVDYVVAKWPD